MDTLSKYKKNILEELELEYINCCNNNIQENLLDNSLDEVSFIRDTLVDLIENEVISIVKMKYIFEKYVVLENVYDISKFIYDLSVDNLRSIYVEKAFISLIESE